VLHTRPSLAEATLDLPAARAVPTREAARPLEETPVPKTSVDRALALGTLLSAVVLVALVAANWQVFQTATPTVSRSNERAVAAVSERAPEAQSTVPPRDEARVGQTAAAPRAGPATLELRAVGGPTWLEVRARDDGGEQLHFDTVPAGETRLFDALPVWVRVGAAERLVIRLAGARVAVPPAEQNGVVEFVASADGIVPGSP
jgi:hypothetical protein